MNQPYAFYEYLSFNGAELFTSVCLPYKSGKFPVVIYRSPYLDFFADANESDIADRMKSDHRRWLEAGYAVILQHCRGRGKSSGDCIPYLNERADGLHLQEWVRNQSFYNGEIYLAGESYTSSVHFVTAPFADDIKGAVLQVQDCNRYNCNYRNGFYKVGLHGEWYVGMYKAKTLKKDNYTVDSYRMLPLSDFSRTVFGESVPDFDGVLANPDPDDCFWNTHFGGVETKDAVKNAGIPILFVTGFYDIFTGGIFDMWNGIKKSSREKCALVVHPYDHSNYPEGQPMKFDGGYVWDTFGNFDVKWFDHIRGKCPAPFETNKITYYNMFGDGWHTDDFEAGTPITFTLGDKDDSYDYDPADPARFNGGLSCNFGGAAWQDPAGVRDDILTYYTPEFTKDTFIKGKMKMKLHVKSDCEDTCFYVRLSLEKTDGSYGLRDDINKISNFSPDYVPGDEVNMTFTFDEHAFTVKKGERIRIDVSSSAFPLYVPHTNYRGLFSEQTKSKVAHNTIMASHSELTVFVV